MADGENTGDFPIVDPHQHFWDLSRNYYPWLCDPKPVHFRYGDYSSLKRNYLPPDYLRDAAGLNIVKTVHEDALWDPSDPAGEPRWLEQVAQEYGYPHACVGSALLARDDIERVLAGHAKYKLTRGVRNFPTAAAKPGDAKRGEAGSMDDPKWRRGYALLEKYGLSFDVQTPWWHLDALAELARDFPNTQIVIVHTALPHDRSEEALAGWRAALEVGCRTAEYRDQDLRARPPRPAVDADRERPDHPRHHQHLRTGALHVRQQLPGRRAGRLVPGHLRRLPRRRVEPADRGATHAVPRQRRAYLSSIKGRTPWIRKCTTRGWSCAAP